MINPSRAVSLDQIQRTESVENQRTEYSTIRPNNSESKRNQTTEVVHMTEVWHGRMNNHQQ